MPSAAAEINTTVTRQPEKPKHYSYLKSFRTEQCKEFLNHRCNLHRPFTCFFWHFPNQRRRRPVLNSKDGRFNYSSDIYCNTYDESTGNCPQGDSCPYLHRNIGDTEKRYHLRYYKTERCIIDTENKGSCTKNGPHCAFAHGPDDIRAPVYDVSERNGISGKSTEQLADLEINGEKEKEKMANIDPRWYGEDYIKLNYKTEPCSRTSRHVTLSCPFYHNPRDRRRPHDVYKYRAVVCPNVKHKEEWTDPVECELGDGCPYIHTRTEQQYHPDIYKTDKCHEEAANGRCSKGIFCAFAHDSTTIPPASPARATAAIIENSSSNALQTKNLTSNEPMPGAARNKNPTNGNTAGQAINNGVALPGSTSDTDSKWLGFSSLKLDSRSNDADIQSRMKQIQPGQLEGNPFYDPSKRSDYCSVYGSQLPNVTSKSASSMMQLNAYHSAIGSAESSFKGGSVLPPSSEAHLLDRLDSLDDDNDHSLLELSNSETADVPQPQMSIFNPVPVQGTPSRFTPFAPAIGLGDTATGLSSSPNVGYSYPLSGFAPVNGGYGLNPTSRLSMYGLSLQPSEIEKSRAELAEAKEIIKRLTDEKLHVIKEREALLHQHQAAALSDPHALTNGGSYLRCLMPTANLEALTVPYLQDLQIHLQLDLRRLQVVMARKAAGKCLACMDRVATTLLPCKHKSLCEPCLAIAKNCPLCGASIPDQQPF